MDAEKAQSSRDNLAIAAGQAEQLAGMLQNELTFQRNILVRLRGKLEEQLPDSATRQVLDELVECASALASNLESAAIGARAQARALARLEKEWI
jgi:hypothetical protein